MTSFSVIIVTYNSAPHIAECLSSVQTAAEGHTVDVIVVDNASPDETKKIVREQFPHVLLLENKQNAGFAAAVNQGAEKGNGKCLLFLNPDTKIEQKFFQKMSEFLVSKPNASIAGVNLVDENGKHQSSCWKKPTLGTTLLEMFLPYDISIQLITENPIHIGEVAMVSGACMAIRRELFDRLTGLDTQFFMYYEDADVCFRARKDGFHIFFLPTIGVYHKISGSGGQPVTLTVQYYKSKMQFFRKHYSRPYAIAVYLIVVGGIIVRTPAYLIAGAILFNKKLFGLGKLYWEVIKRIGAI